MITFIKHASAKASGSEGTTNLRRRRGEGRRGEGRRREGRRGEGRRREERGG